MRHLLIVLLVPAAVAPLTTVDQQQIRPRVVRGEEALPHAHPFVVGLIRADDQSYCTGSVIARQWVLTAAHCFDDYTAADVRIAVNYHDVTDLDGGTHECAETIDVAEVVEHPRYDEDSTMNGDIALLRLAHPVTCDTGRLERAVVALSDGHDADGHAMPTPYDAFVAGWGTLYDDREYPGGVGSPGWVEGTPLYASTLQLGRVQARRYVPLCGAFVRCAFVRCAVLRRLPRGVACGVTVPCGAQVLSESYCTSPQAYGGHPSYGRRPEPAPPCSLAGGMRARRGCGARYYTWSMMCAHNVSSGDGDACYGDSGGPLWFEGAGGPVQAAGSSCREESGGAARGVLVTGPRCRRWA
jgi:hypothetical protein